jgi:osmotically-inducible protein OsmY
VDGEVTTVRGVGIEIAARNGVVTLIGTVESADVMRRAEAIARAVAGVKAVDNKLVSAALFHRD